MALEERPWPTELRLTGKGSTLQVRFDNGESHELSAEYLRVESPSAEVKGHGPGQEVTVPGKQEVTILSLDPIGNYAVKITFSDGHATGIYAWDYLLKLGREHEEIWNGYLAKLEAEGLSRTK